MCPVIEPNPGRVGRVTRVAAATLAITGAVVLGISFVIVGPLWLTGGGLVLATVGLGLFWLGDHLSR